MPGHPCEVVPPRARGDSVSIGGVVARGKYAETSSHHPLLHPRNVTGARVGAESTLQFARCDARNNTCRYLGMSLLHMWGLSFVVWELRFGMGDNGNQAEG